MKRQLGFLAIASFALVVGCKGKQTQSDADSLGAGGTPGIESQAMDFNPSGSDSGAINGLKTVFFGFDQSNLDATAKADLAGNAAWIKARPNVKVQIEGHCDQRGTIEYNVALGERRANAVKAYLVSLGVSAAQLSTISYGEERPLATGDSEADMGRNRRANFMPAQ